MSALLLPLCLICVFQRVGCDRVLGSNAVPDLCGICKGDNSTCKIYKGQYTKQHYLSRTCLPLLYEHMNTILIRAGKNNVSFYDYIKL